MRNALISLALVGSVIACGSDTADPPTGTTGDALANAGPVAAQYATNVHANYVEALAKAKALQIAIDAFVAAPSPATHEAAKAAWIAARAPYSPSEVYRFYGGPIDDEKTGPEGAINAWPLDENFIDYTVDDDGAGIVNHPELVAQITEDAIRGENEKGGEKNISSGYHAIEFLLWGQDTDPPSMKTAGKRPHTDFVVGAGATAKNQERRGQYLKVVAAMLVADLESLVDAWAPGKDNYAKTFVADPKDAVTKMLVGIGSMANAELSGERMTVAFKNRDQEDEHSCFSDTTNDDIEGNAKGIENVYLGKYGASDGQGLEDLVKAVDPALDAEMKKAIADANAALAKMKQAPFDYSISQPDGSPERDAVLAVIKAVKAEAELIVRIGAKLGVTFELEEPSEQL
ncbi:MAG: iron-regulated protein [Labilithrix sp.]|nr:iron-regulated protein [Labilithrix sp.]